MRLINNTSQACKEVCQYVIGFEKQKHLFKKINKQNWEIGNWLLDPLNYSLSFCTLKKVNSILFIL